MNKSNKICNILFTMLCAAVTVGSAALILFFFTEFKTICGGTYQVQLLNGDPLNVFIMKLVFIGGGLVLGAIFTINHLFKRRRLYPVFITFAGVFTLLTALCTAYNLSRIMGATTVQSISGTAIIVETVFATIAMLFIIGALLDFAARIFDGENNVLSKGENFIFYICGAIFGAALTSVLGGAIREAVGIYYVFLALSIMILIASAGICVLCNFDKIKSSVCKNKSAEASETEAGADRQD